MKGIGKLLLLAAFAGCSVSVSAQIVLEELESHKGVFAYRYDDSDYTRAFAFVAPTYFIYPDGKVDRDGAQHLLDEMGFNRGALKDNANAIFVINPLEEQYSASPDFERFRDIYNLAFLHINIKVIGIGSGADFVNCSIAPQAEGIAGIVSIGAKTVPQKASAPVPAFICGRKAEKIAQTYINGSQAILQQKDASLKIYENREEALLRVVVDGKSDKTLASVMERAWDTLLSRNYRLSNHQHTCYMGETLGSHPFELAEYMYLPNLGMKKNIVERNLLAGKGDYLWFEYYNEAVENAEAGTVPLLVLLHGNGNDPRTQAETSGFVQLASRENFMVIDLEWQGTNKRNEWMGLDGIELVVNEVLANYPQLDPERVYAEGLSAGAFCATALGIHKSYLFAAVGANSGGVISGSLNEGIIHATGFSPKSLWGDAGQKRSHVQMPYFSICGTIDGAVPFPCRMDVRDQFPGGVGAPPVLPPEESSIFQAWRLYRFLNGADDLQTFDVQADAVFGQQLEKRRRQTIKAYDVESGEVIVDGIPLMKLIAVMDYGHWNFAPGASMMWEFFKQFSRDRSTGELKFCPPLK